MLLSLGIVKIETKDVTVNDFLLNRFEKDPFLNLRQTVMFSWFNFIAEYRLSRFMKHFLKSEVASWRPAVPCPPPTFLVASAIPSTASKSTKKSTGKGTYRTQSPILMKLGMYIVFKKIFDPYLFDRQWSMSKGWKLPSKLGIQNLFYQVSRKLLNILFLYKFMKLLFFSGVFFKRYIKKTVVWWRLK